MAAARLAERVVVLTTSGAIDGGARETEAGVARFRTDGAGASPRHHNRLPHRHATTTGLHNHGVPAWRDGRPGVATL